MTALLPERRAPESATTHAAGIRLDGDDLQQCIRCGMCLEACPTYLITGLETESPRGRIHLMDALAKGRIEPTPEATVHLDRCLACRACEAVCPSGVPYGRLIETARAELRSLVAPSRRRRWSRDSLLTTLAGRQHALSVAGHVLSLYERLGLRSFMRRTGLARRLPEGLRRMEQLYPPFARPRYTAPSGPAAPTARVALLLGCVMRVAYGDVHSAAARLLVRHGVEVVDVPAQTCCGALHAHAGDHDDSVALAKRNIAAFEAERLDAIVVDAAGCGAHMKGYGELLGHEPEWAGRASAIAAKVKDVTEYLAVAVGDASLGSLDLRITYQDPCHLAHAQRIRSQPRVLLGKVAGLTLTEMHGADVCCGSAGTYNVTQPDYADRLLERKIDAIVATDAQAVVTANPGCMLQIEAGLRARGREIPVLHVVEVLDRATRHA